MERNTYGYVRVSTQVQNEARQLAAMREFGVEDENIIIEKQSGRDFKRPLYQQLVDGLRAGDVLVVKSIDRLGRNYTEIWNSGRSLPKSRTRPLWCWICPCWTPGRAGISPGR